MTRLEQPHVGVFRLNLFERSETFILSQARHYTTFSPVFVGRCGTQPPPQDVEWSAIPGDFASLSRFILFRDASGLAKQLRPLNLKIIHAHFAIDGSAAVPLSRKLGVPLVVTLHGFDVTASDQTLVRSGQPTHIQSLIYRSTLFEQASAFICVSEFIRQSALAKGFPSDKLIVQPIGIDLKRYSPSESYDENTIVHVGRLVEKKGTAYLIRAMPLILEKRPSTRLIIIGDGPLLPELKERVQAFGIKDAVTFMGHQPHHETLAWLTRAAVVCVPSITARNGDCEGLPTIIYEAGAFGVPVVASRTSGIPEAVRHGETGLLVEEKDVTGIAKGVLELLNCVSTRLRLGNKARELMEKEFNIEMQTSKLERLYSTLV